MKRLELTKRHKILLYKMLLKLYPEYSYIELQSDIDYVGFIGFGNQDSDNLQDVFHWFEFCVKHLIFRICTDKDGNEDIMEIETTRALFCSLPNPIDYLYDKFKKLKS